MNQENLCIIYYLYFIMLDDTYKAKKTASLFKTCSLYCYLNVRDAV